MNKFDELTEDARQHGNLSQEQIRERQWRAIQSQHWDCTGGRQDEFVTLPIVVQDSGDVLAQSNIVGCLRITRDIANEIMALSTGGYGRLVLKIVVSSAAPPLVAVAQSIGSPAE